MKITPVTNVTPIQKYKSNKDKHDEGVMCGQLTEYKQTDHVNIRNHYVEGAGQLCDGCYNKAYGWHTM